MSNRGTILIVEDDPDMQPLLAFIFEQEGYETVGFDDGTQAWAYLESTDDLPDCMVLDLKIPGIDGIEILERRQDSAAIRDVPVLVLTGWDSEETVMDVFDREADDYITKPFSRNEVLVRVRRLLA